MDSETVDFEVIDEPKKKKNIPLEDYPPIPETPRRRRRVGCWLALGCLGMCCLCWVLPACALIAGGVTLAAIFDMSSVSATGTERLDLEPARGVVLNVDNPVGEITIQPGTEDAIIVDYRKTARGFTEAEARKELDKITVELARRDDGTIAVVANPERTEDDFFFRANQVDLTITLPPKAEIIVRGNVGDITITGIQAETLDVKSNTGDLTFDGELGAAGRFSLATNVGNITARLPGDIYLKLDASSDVGEVNLIGFEQAERESGARGVGDTWRGTLGSGEERPPELWLETNVGSVTVEAR